MKPDDPSIRQRLAALELAEALGNVSEACRRTGVSRSQFYHYRQRFEEHGLAGLANRPPAPRFHPFTTPDEAVERVLALSAAQPTWGCGRISRALAEEGCALSSPTVQKILIRHGLGQRAERLVELERRYWQEGAALDGAQIAALEKANPCFRDRHAPRRTPGELLWQAVLPAGRIDYLGRLYLHVAVDVAGGCAFGRLATGAEADEAIALLREDVLPFYRARGLAVCAVQHLSGGAFGAASVYAHFLRAHDIGQWAPVEVAPGCFERLRQAARLEFLGDSRVWADGSSVATVQAALRAWLAHYNSRPQPGCPTFGLSPLAMLAHPLAQPAAK